MSSPNEPVPERGPELPEDAMLLSFDVDCGFLFDGHRLIARGIASHGPIDAPNVDTLDLFVGISLEYELVPGATAGSADLHRYLVSVAFAADVPLPWPATDGGAVAPMVGGPSTHGSLGDWPLPADAQVLFFDLTGRDPVTENPRPQPDGTLIVDLRDSTARWRART